MARKTSLILTLTDDERRELEAWQRCTTMRAGLVRRARVVLLRARGTPISHIARQAGIRYRHAEKWIKRFLASRIDGLSDRPGRGRKPRFSPGRGGPPRQDRMRAA